MIFQETFAIYTESVVGLEYGEDFPGKKHLDEHLAVSAWNARWSFEYPDEPYFGAPDFPWGAKRGEVIDVVATLVSHQYCDSFPPQGFFIPDDCVMACSSPGRDASPYVKEWMKNEEIVVLFSKFLQEELRAYCKEAGTWSDTETADIEIIRERCLWMWCCDCREQKQQGETL